MDKDYNAKLTYFSLSISIPEGETIVEDQVMGTIGYLDPEYMITGYVSEKSDVYGFGAFMILLLIGKTLHSINDLLFEDKIIKSRYISPEDLHRSLRYFLNYKPLHEVVDCEIFEEEGGISQEQGSQFQAFLKLALRCIQYKSGDRPLMIDVAKEVRQIEKSTMVAQQPYRSGT